MSNQRVRLLEQVAARVPEAGRGDCVLVAVDGVDGAGKTMFADELAATLSSAGRPVIRISADGFHHPRAVRHARGRESALGFWLDSYDYASLRAEVLQPLGPGGSRHYRTAVHDVVSDRALDVPVRQAEAGSILVLDGLFLHRDGLVDVWDMSVFLRVPFEVSAARMAARDGSHPDPRHPSLARYQQGQRLYFAACQPWRRATVVVDNTTIDEPFLVSVGSGSMQTTLSGALVTLRTATADDVPALVRIRATPEVYARWRGGEDLTTSVTDDLSDPDTQVFAILHDDRVVGAVQWAAETDPEYRHANIDIYVDPAVHGRGIGTDAVRTLARHLFVDHGHHRLTIDPAADNEQAIRSYAKVGFRPVGVMRQYELGADGNWHDGLLMDLLAGELLDPHSAA